MGPFCLPVSPMVPVLGAVFEELEEAFGDGSSALSAPCLRVAWGEVGAGAGSACRPDGAREAEQMKLCARWKVGAEDEAVRGRVGDEVFNTPSDTHIIPPP